MKLLFTADCQLGYRQYYLKDREKDFMRVFLQVVEYARVLRPAALVVAGDLFEHGTRPPELETAVREQVRSLVDAGIQVLGVEGNHDRSADGCSTLKICDIVPLTPNMPHVFENGVRICGINYHGPPEPRARLTEVLSGIPETDILVMHQMFDEICGIGGEIAAGSVAELAGRKGVRLVAAGHMHDFWTSEKSGVKFFYTGSTEMTDCDERPEKFIVEADIEPGASPAVIKAVQLSTRPVRKMVLSTEKELTELLQRLPENAAMLMVDADRGLSGSMGLLESRAGELGIPVRVAYFCSEGPASAGSVRREATMSTLDEVVSKKFDPGSDEHGLVVEILASPAAVAPICREYLMRKGVKL